MSTKTRLTIIVRILIVVIWAVLFATLLNRDYFIKKLLPDEEQVLKRAREESFMGIYFQNERIGYVKNRLTKTGPDEIELNQSAYLLLNILNENHPVDMRARARLNERLLLKDFVFHFSSPFYKMDAEGKVVDHDVHFTLTTGKETISDVIRLNNPPYMSTNQRGYLLKQDLKAGDKFKVPYFDPLSLSGKDTIMEYKGREKVLIHGRVFNLHHFLETFSGVRVNSWLDDQGKVIKEESPAGFLFISEPEFKATDIVAKGREILSSVSVPLAGVLPELTGLTAIHYRLHLPENAEFDLNNGRQSFNNGVLTITRELLPAADIVACSGPAAELASTPYIQSNNQKIAELSRSLVKDIAGPLARVRVLTAWVYENLEKRPVLGIPDAITTLDTRMGDCNEHAALFAALARNAGIPTRIAAGVTFHEGAFYYHAWNEVCLGGSWLTLDSTRNQLPADITHIKFVEGETEEQVKIGALLGNLRIEIVEP